MRALSNSETGSVRGGGCEGLVHERLDLTLRKTCPYLARDIPQSRASMTTFRDFVTWAETQRRAAELLGLSESMVSLIVSGKRPLQPQHAIRAEQVSGGFFLADALLPETEFNRSESGEVIGWHVKANNGDS